MLITIIHRKFPKPTTLSYNNLYAVHHCRYLILNSLTVPKGLAILIPFNFRQRYIPNRHYNYHTQPTPRPQGPKPQPMEVDESMRTRRIDYMNRPRPNYNRERPPPSINQHHGKITRKFHIYSEF